MTQKNSDILFFPTYSLLSWRAGVGICLSIATVLVLANFGVWLALHVDWLANLSFELSKAYERVPDAMQYHQAVMDFYYHDTPIPSRFFTSSEISHFADVQFWVKGSEVLLLIGGVGMGVSAGILKRSSYYFMAKGAWLWLGLLVGLLILAMLAWILFFRGWHPLFFAEGNWDFNPQVHRMLMLYDHTYLALSGAVILVCSVIPTGVLLAVGWRCRPTFKWVCADWRKISWRVAVVGLLLLCLASFVAGRHMIEPSDAGWYYFYVISVAVLAGIISLFMTRVTVLQSTLVVLLIANYYALNLGVRANFDDCSVFETKMMPIQKAIEAYSAKHGRYPSSMDKWFKENPALTVSPMGTPVRYQRYVMNGTKKDFYTIGFRAPLASDYSYSSLRNTWLHIKRP